MKPSKHTPVTGSFETTPGKCTPAKRLKKSVPSRKPENKNLLPGLVSDAKMFIKQKDKKWYETVRFFQNVFKRFNDKAADSDFIKFCNSCNKHNHVGLKDELYCALNTYPELNAKIIDVLSVISGENINYEDIRTTPLRKGLANHGIFLHSIKDTDTRIVEKITTIPDENIVFSHMANTAKNASAILPAVYGYISYNSVGVCLMQHLDNTAIIPKFSEYNAAKIAEAIIAFESFLEGIPGLREESVLKNSRITAKVDHIIHHLNCPQLRNDSALLYRVVEKGIAPEYKNYNVPCHGDFAFPNMSIQTNSDDRILDIKLFDFGLCAKRPVGYEFHHLIKKCIGSSKKKAFVLQIIRDYAAWKKLDEDLVYQNAVFFSIVRSLYRISSYIRKEKTFVKEMNTIVDMARLFLSLRA